MKIVIFIFGALIILLLGLFIIKNEDIFISSNPSNNQSTGVKEKIILDLSNQMLAKIPDYVFKQNNLEELNISNNSLTGSIQAEIRFLTKLTILNASNNLMTGIPAEIGQLQSLEVLDLSNNKLTGLPNELGNLSSLKILNLSGNQYSKQDLDYIRSKLPAMVHIIIN